MLIGARTGAWAANGGGWTNPYVTDGLVAMWDGEWNAGPGKHDASATVWKDLVGIADMACSSAPTWGDKQAMIGSYFYSDESSSVVNAFNSHSVTLEIVYGDITQKLNNTGPFGIGSDSSVFRIQQNRASNTACSAVFLGDAHNLSSFLGSVSNDYGNQHVAFTVDSNSRKAYNFGTLYSTRTASFTSLLEDGSRMFVGRSPLNESRGYGIREVRIYNRALTADEIAANYAVDKVRFGLA